MRYTDDIEQGERKGRQEDGMITSEAINRAIDYILQHIEEELSLNEVAAHCYFSPYYFSRLFKTQTGESVYQFIKRVRLEQSAFRLKTEKERSITEISADYGYSSSNYSSAFRQHYKTSPVSFRKKSYQGAMEHPFFHHEQWRAESFADCNQKIAIKEIPDYRMIYERRFGSYEHMHRDWDELLVRYRDYISGDTKFLEVTYDDPSLTRAKNCLYDIGLSVGEECRLENTTVLCGGKCAVYSFKGHIKAIYAAYQTLFLVWLPKTRYRLDERRNIIDIYHAVDCAAMEVEMDICVPVR